MSHFSVVVCIDSPDRLEQVMAPWDENKDMEPYRSYEEGAPAEFWATEGFREKHGLNPDNATLTWAQVAEVHNRVYDDSEPLLIDESDGRAYQMSTYNPECKWDYWRIGGRWGGYFPYKPEAAARVLRSKRDWDSRDVKPLHCDGGVKRDLDLAALRDEKAAEARAKYAEFAALTDGTPDAKAWAQFLADENAGRITIDEARTLYHAQPRVQAIGRTDFRWHDDPLTEFGQPLALYVEKERARAVPGYATITLDGRWMAPGRMGWFGCSDDDEGDRIGYWEAVNAYIEALPDDVWLIVTDCHI